jgi:hypothetical protein
VNGKTLQEKSISHNELDMSKHPTLQITVNDEFDDFFSNDDSTYLPKGDITKSPKVFETELTKRFEELEKEEEEEEELSTNDTTTTTTNTPSTVSTPNTPATPTDLSTEVKLTSVRRSSVNLGNLDASTELSNSRGSSPLRNSRSSSSDLSVLDFNNVVDVTGEQIPLLFSHRIYRYNVRLNVYEMVNDVHAVTGWRNIYIAVQYKNQFICISQASGMVYRKVVRSSLQTQLGEEDSYIISSDIQDWNETRCLLFIDGILYFIRARDVYSLDLTDYTFKKRKKTGVGKWKKNIFSAIGYNVYGVDEETGNIQCYNFQTEQITKTNGMRDWRDTAGIVIHNDNLILFTNNGMFRMDPTTGVYKLLAREETWSLYLSCVAKVNANTVIFIRYVPLYSHIHIINT